MHKIEVCKEAVDSYKVEPLDDGISMHVYSWYWLREGCQALCENNQDCTCVFCEHWAHAFIVPNSKAEGGFTLCLLTPEDFYV